MIAERFERLRADLAPLASPSAFSLTTVVVASPLIFAIQVPANFRVAGGPFALWALASVTGLLVMAGVLARRFGTFSSSRVVFSETPLPWPV